ncbi:MAG: class I SAM-dependent methyltransferase [Chloroflexi bacterium]|nr:MAG: class I SAM-dependent methyltransferase [Chloroflexota bacterium]
MDTEGTMQDYTYEILFDSEADHWWLASRRKLVVDWVRQRYPGRDDLHILDVGCGTGMMLLDLAGLGTAQGIDVSDEALRFCRRRGLQNVQKGDVLALPFADATFDLLTGVDILEHVEDDVAAVREWGRVLKPGGRLFLFVPAHRWLWSLQDEISGHRRRYTARTLRRVIHQAGLSVERQSYVSTFLFPVILIGRIWLKGLRRFRDVKTENTLHPAWSNGLLRGIFSAEIPLLRHVNFPYGASLLCIAHN